MSEPSPFENETALPDELLFAREKSLLGFKPRFDKIHDQLRLLLNSGELQAWNNKHHKGKLAVTELVAEHPGHQGQLFLAADRAHDRAGLAVKLRGAQQVRVGVTDLRDTRAAGVDLGQQ